MTVVLDPVKCHACGKLEEPLCMRICPGDLFVKTSDGVVEIRCPEECWDCASCVKVCPRQAISLMLPVEAGGRGGRMYARKKGSHQLWVIISLNGEELELLI